MSQKPKIVIVGSLAYDDIKTPEAACRNVLGGSVTFASVAASFFAKAGMVAVAGTDFKKESLARLRKCGLDLQGLQIKEGRTFRWSGVYEKDFNRRRTLRTELNLFQSFKPELPEQYRKIPFLFLANIAPALQAHVLEQVRSPRFVMADTMNLWIGTARAELVRLIGKIDLLLINDEEARQLTGDKILIHAARKILGWGPSHVIIKKGEHGSMLISKDDILFLPAYPVLKLVDPTGAGDAFAGGFIGCLAGCSRVSMAVMRQARPPACIAGRSTAGRPASVALRRAMIYGTITASFAVESFSIDKLARVTRADINRRAREFQRMIRV